MPTEGVPTLRQLFLNPTIEKLQTEITALKKLLAQLGIKLSEQSIENAELTKKLNEREQVIADLRRELFKLKSNPQPIYPPLIVQNTTDNQTKPQAEVLQKLTQVQRLPRLKQYQIEISNHDIDPNFSIYNQNRIRFINTHNAVGKIFSTLISGGYLYSPKFNIISNIQEGFRVSQFEAQVLGGNTTVLLEVYFKPFESQLQQLLIVKILENSSTDKQAKEYSYIVSEVNTNQLAAELSKKFGSSRRSSGNGSLILSQRFEASLDRGWLEDLQSVEVYLEARAFYNL